MTGSSSLPRYQPHPDHLHWELRVFFCVYLVKEQAYSDATKALSPLWQEVLDKHQDIAPNTPFNLLPKPSNPHDALGRYVSALQTEVSDRLRCREQGVAAEWVCHAVHAGVNGDTPFDAGVSPQHYLWHGTLQIPIISAGFAIVLGKINDHPITDESEADRLTITAQQPGTTFNQWKALKKLAHQELDQLLEELRDQVEGATSDWPRLNQRGRTTRTQETMPKLVEWVVGRKEHIAGDRSATNDLLKELRLDAPGKSEKKSKNRAFSSETPSSETL